MVGGGVVAGAAVVDTAVETGALEGVGGRVVGLSDVEVTPPVGAAVLELRTAKKTTTARTTAPATAAEMSRFLRLDSMTLAFLVHRLVDLTDRQCPRHRSRLFTLRVQRRGAR